MVLAKICGLKTPETLHIAAQNGARFAGFVFYPRSPRALRRDEARVLAGMVPTGLRSVGLFVDPDDDLLEDVVRAVPLDMIQLHGHETPKRVAEIKSRYGLQVIKAMPVATPDDLILLPDYEVVADWILFDAKPPSNVAALPGGNGLVFDWTILTTVRPQKPWMLSGGLTPENVAKALELLKPDAVDVSSGVEASPGVKDPAKIKAFLEATRSSISGT